jgi:hypothetical protein
MQSATKESSNISHYCQLNSFWNSISQCQLNFLRFSSALHIPWLRILYSRRTLDHMPTRSHQYSKNCHKHFSEIFNFYFLSKMLQSFQIFKFDSTLEFLFRVLKCNFFESLKFRDKFLRDQLKSIKKLEILEFYQLKAVF